jgi:hypothetical protein
LVISAYLDPDFIRRMKSVVVGILVKPFNLATLQERVCAAIAPASSVSPLVLTRGTA